MGEIRPAGSGRGTIIDVNLPPGNYLLTASIQFESRSSVEYLLRGSLRCCWDERSHAHRYAQAFLPLENR